MIEVKTTTIQIPISTLIEIKAMAVKKGKTQNNIINELINEGLKSINRKKRKVKSNVINHKMPFYNIDKKASLNDIIGIAKIDKEIDINEVIDSIHIKKDLY
jgi:hypothetical protein